MAVKPWTSSVLPADGPGNRGWCRTAAYPAPKAVNTLDELGAAFA